MAFSGREIVRIINKAIEPLWRSVQILASRCVLDSLKDSESIQIVKVQILSGESQELERIQSFGFSSNPVPLSEGVCLFIGGSRDHGIVLAIDDRNSRPKDKNEGSSTQYDISGSEVYLDGQGNIEEKASIKHDLKTPLIDIGSGPKEAALNGQTFQSGYNLHTHSVFGVATTPPQTPSPPTDLSTAVKIAKTP